MGGEGGEIEKSLFRQTSSDKSVKSPTGGAKRTATASALLSL